VSCALFPAGTGAVEVALMAILYSANSKLDVLFTESFSEDDDAELVDEKAEEDGAGGVAGSPALPVLVSGM